MKAKKASGMTTEKILRTKWVIAGVEDYRRS